MRFRAANRADLAMMMEVDTGARGDLLTVALEDYYHVGAFSRLIRLGQWSRFESRLEHGTRRTLALLEETGTRATFFVLGWVADNFPELVREVADRGHEIASKGYYHRDVRELSPVEFTADVAQARDALESVTGHRVLGYRVADRWWGPDDLWRLDVLADQGHLYDSSATPLLGAFRREPWRRFPYRRVTVDGKTIWEMPVSTVSMLGYGVPIGGNAFRQFPAWWTRAVTEHWHRRVKSPLITYFHTWELDPEQPRITAASPIERVRHYRNLDRIERVLRDRLTRYRHGSIAGYLGLTAAPAGAVTSVVPAPLRATAPAAPTATRVRSIAGDRPRVSIVVPCFNEQDNLPLVRNTLLSVEATLRDRYAVDWIFVDDGSQDATWIVLNRLFGGDPRVQLIRHPLNRGLMAAIVTAARASRSDLVASIDCDCSYDPHELERMLPLMGPGVDLVTASPYHPEGAVEHVARWRLFLSRTLSRLYRLVLRQKVYTCTSCFRVYRRDVLTRLAVRRGGFLGVAELLAAVDLSGGVIVEHPTTLMVRVLGRSSLKVARTVLGHLGLLGELVWRRLAGLPQTAAPRSEPINAGR